MYFPFPASSTNATWSVEYGYYDMTWGNQVINGTTFYGTMGDTTIDGSSYVKVYECGFPWTSDTVFNPATALLQYAYRESNKQIFMRIVTDTVEHLHYDFNLAMGDSFYFYNAGLMGWHYVTSVDSIIVNGSYRRTLTFDATDTWIEGIGSDAGFIESNLLIGNIYTLLLCYSENGNVLHSPYETCNRFSGTGLNENSNLGSIKIYPNPITDFLNIENLNKIPFEIFLYDIASRKLLQQKFTDSISLNTAQLATGLYLYEVRGENGVYKKGKVVKY